MPQVEPDRTKFQPVAQVWHLPQNDVTQKRAGVVLGILLAPLVLYLLVANVFLATPLLVKLTNRKPEKFFMTYDSAWTFWPGHVHVRGFHMRFQTYRVAFELDIDKSTAEIALTELLNRRFVAKNVGAHGVSYRHLHKVDPKQALDERTLAFPMIAGVAPNVSGPRPDPKQKPKSKKVWSVRLDDVDAHIDEVWIQEYRWRGKGTAVGSFEIVPRQSFWVGPVHTELQPGLVTVGKEIVSTNFGGEADTTITRVEFIRERKLRMLKGLNIDGHFEGDVDDLKFLRVYGLTGSGDGKLAVDADIREGTLREGTKVALDLPRVNVRYAKEGGGFTGSASVRAWDDEKPRVHAEAKGEVYIPLGGERVVSVAAPHTTGDLALTTSDFSKGTRLAWFDVKAPRLEAKDTKPLIDAMKGKVPFIVPALLGSGPLRAREVQARGSPKRVRLRVGQARMGETRVRGQVDIGGGRANGAIEANVAKLPIGITLKEGRPAFTMFAKPGWLEDHLKVESQRSALGEAGREPSAEEPQRGEQETTGRDAPAGDSRTAPSR